MATDCEAEKQTWHGGRGGLVAIRFSSRDVPVLPFREALAASGRLLERIALNGRFLRRDSFLSSVDKSNVAFHLHRPGDHGHHHRA